MPTMKNYHKCFIKLLQDLEISKPATLSSYETPLEYRTDISFDVDRKIYLKREDLIDSLGCGHKLRKLSYVIPDITEKNASVLVTYGSLPSNQCKAVAAVAAKLRLKSHVIYGGDNQVKPDIAQGNYLLSILLASTISWFEKTPWERINEKVEEIINIEKGNGEVPYLISSGIFSWLGLLGSIELGFELARQSELNNVKFDNIVATAGSGGTCLGLQIAAELMGLKWKVFGVCIGQTSDFLDEKLLKMKKEFFQRIGCFDISNHGITLFNGAIGEGYDMPQIQELECVAYAIKHYGLFFDPNYMAKTYLGMKELIRNDVIEKRDATVLIHSGGQMGIFDNSVSLSGWSKDRLRTVKT